MLKDYLRKNGISIYSLSKNSGVPYSTVNDIANGKVSIDTCRFGVVSRLANTLGLDINTFATLCNRTIVVDCEGYKTEVNICEVNKYYYADFQFDEASYRIKLFSADNSAADYVEEIAGWEAKDILEPLCLEKLWERDET